MATAFVEISFVFCFVGKEENMLGECLLVGYCALGYDYLNSFLEIMRS